MLFKEYTCSTLTVVPIYEKKFESMVCRGFCSISCNFVFFVAAYLMEKLGYLFRTNRWNHSWSGSWALHRSNRQYCGQNNKAHGSHALNIRCYRRAFRGFDLCFASKRQMAIGYANLCSHVSGVFYPSFWKITASLDGFRYSAGFFSYLSGWKNWQMGL